MSEDKIGDKNLPHHEQQALCTTRLPYRQGRKLTAVKVYTINDESNHLLIFGVPSLNLRQEAKALFQKFGTLKLFNLAKEYKSERFTETYHTAYERIQSARIAKRMLDTKNFYGGSLHITYAPELEDLEETKAKLLQRKHDVLTRLRNLQREKDIVKDTEVQLEIEKAKPKLNMGKVNIIHIGGTIKKRKRKEDSEMKRFKPCFDDIVTEPAMSKITTEFNERLNNIEMVTVENTNIEIVDCTSVEIETITNVNEHNQRSNECIKIYKIPEKPLNKIKFKVSKKI